jgi:hypothetical protein
MWRCPFAFFRWKRRLSNRHLQRTFSKVGAMVVVVEKGGELVVVLDLHMILFFCSY